MHQHSPTIPLDFFLCLPGLPYFPSRRWLNPLATSGIKMHKLWVHTVKAMVFPVVMYECKTWIMKKAECCRIHALESWCWRRLLRVPWTARRSNQSVLKEINPKYPLQGLMLKLKLQYFDHLMWRPDSLEKTLMLGKIESRKRKGW